MNRFTARKKGFTLIELLIVIAIILILIAIALPNFLEAQIRAKVTKAKAEIRTLGIAMESYFLDFKVYPCESEHNLYDRRRFEAGLTWLTSPIRYIAEVPQDPFGGNATADAFSFYEMGGVTTVKPPCMGQCTETWAIFTKGPDLTEDDVDSSEPNWITYTDGSVDAYAATNGTKSKGDIFLYGGDSFWIGVRTGVATKKNYTPAQDVGLLVNNEFYLHRMPPRL
jgi:type II secretion system protein G